MQSWLGLLWPAIGALERIEPRFQKAQWEFLVNVANGADLQIAQLARLAKNRHNSLPKSYLHRPEIAILV